jgi:hypothetical protein
MNRITDITVRSTFQWIKVTRDNSKKKFTFAVGEYYHVYNRGVEKRDIFKGDSDRLRFQRML